MMRSYDESQAKSKRLSSVWQSKRQKLHDDKVILTSKAPYWIKVIKDKGGKPTGFEIDENEALSIRKIFDLSLNQNLGSYAITNHLNQNKHLYQKSRSHKAKKDKGWSQSYVQKVLKNPAVYGALQPNKLINGKRVPDGDLVKGYYPALITEEEFLLNAERMKMRRNNSQGRKTSGFKNLFNGLLKCAGCGSTVAFMNKGDGPKGGNKLQCSASRQSRQACDAMSISYEAFEEMFFKALDDVRFITASESVELKAKERNLELEIARLKSEQERLNKTIDSLIENMSSDDMSDRLKSRLRDSLTSTDEKLTLVEDRLVSASSELQQLLDGHSTDELIRDVRSLLDGNHSDEDLRQIRRTINLAIQKVILEISVDALPSFTTKDVAEGKVNTMDLNETFVDWFFENVTYKWSHQDPLEYVGSRHGHRIYHDFDVTALVRFRSGEVRQILSDGKVLVGHFDPENQVTLEEIFHDDD
jgi:hypothetical protein